MIKQTSNAATKGARIEMSQREENESEDCESGDTEETRSNRQRQLAEIFRPILIALKLMGQYFGETSLGEGSNQRTRIISYFSSALVVLGQWLIVAFGITSLIYVGFSSMSAFFFLLVNTAWYIQCAGNTIACLSVLPLTSKTRSRFAKFLSSFVTASRTLDGMKKKTLMGLAIACLAAVLNAIIIVLFSVRSSGLISVFPPWNRHPGLYLTVRVMVLVFGTLDSFAMTLPPLIFCITCILLEKMFCALHNEVSQESDHSFTVASLRQEHLKLCEVVELANSLFSPLLFVIISLDIPLICVNFYQLIKRSSEAETIEMLGYVYWNVCLSTLLVVIFTFGNRVNEKAHCFYETLQKSRISVEDSKENTELVLFLAHLRGEPIGLSVGGIAVVNKSLFLTLFGIIASYFVVLLTLPT